MLTSMIRPFTVFNDKSEKQYLDTMEKHIQQNDFIVAAEDNEKQIHYYQDRSHVGDDVIGNYLQQAQLMRMLVKRIISDTDKIHELETNLQKKTEEMELCKKNNQQLIEQIKKLKHIDLKKRRLP